MPEDEVPTWWEEGTEMDFETALAIYIELLRICIDILLENNYMDLRHNVYGTTSILEAYPPPDAFVQGRTDSPALIRTKVLFHLLGGFALVNLEATIAIHKGLSFHPSHVPIIMGYGMKKVSEQARKIVQNIKQTHLT
jgi:hypothetical protein